MKKTKNGYCAIKGYLPCRKHELFFDDETCIEIITAHDIIKLKGVLRLKCEKREDF